MGSCLDKGLKCIFLVDDCILSKIAINLLLLEKYEQYQDDMLD